MHYDHLRFSRHDDVAVVAMARPPVNAVHVPMYDELHDLFRHVAEREPDVRAVVLTGEGRHFCAGNDLDEFQAMTAQTCRVNMFHVREAFFAVQECPLPVIGAVHGVALGTGLALAASCDFVVAARGATFGLPEVTVGVMGGARHLYRLVSQPIVRWMALTGETISADELWRLGGIVEVTDDGDHVDRAVQMGATIAGHSPTVVSQMKECLNEVEEMGLQAGYTLEQGGTCALAEHPDAKEAVAAIRERRPPVFPRPEATR